MSEFQDFPKMARWTREVIITEKIDGTNAQVFIGEDGLIRAGSRTRWITPEDDNHGFAAWVQQHVEELRKLGQGRHFGEWWGSGVQRGYALPKGEKRFSLFNASRWYDPRDCDHEDITGRVAVPSCCRVVPILLRGMNMPGIFEQCVDLLRVNGSYASPGFMDPEGAVMFHIDAGVGFKKTVKKDEAPKGRG